MSNITEKKSSFSFISGKSIPNWVSIALLGVIVSIGVFYLFNKQRFSANTASNYNIDLSKKDTNNKPTPVSEQNTPSGLAYNKVNPQKQHENINSEILPFKREIQYTIDKIIADGKATKVSVIFQALNDGYSFELNEDEKYFSASLIKVPLMMYYYKLAEKETSILEKKIQFKKDKSIKLPNFIECPPMKEDEYYTINTLIERLIKYSDNDAAIILEKYENKEGRNKIYSQFDLVVPEVIGSGIDYLSVGDYVNVFRVLYNGGYLNNKMSQKALDVLSLSDFKLGIKAGLPTSVTVANKHGMWERNGEYQMHEFAIVYQHNKPYILGVMTKGRKPLELCEGIALISKKTNECVLKRIDVDL